MLLHPRVFSIIMNVTSMPYIKNPFGRIVEVDEAYYNDWLGSPGFSQPTPEEVKESNDKRTKQVEQWKKEEELGKSLYGKPGVYFVTVSQGGKDGYGVTSKNLFEELKNIGVNISFQNTGQKIALLLHAPHSITRLESPIRLLYTMFESTKIPAEWVDYLEQADRVLVPSKFCQEVFAKSGIESQVIPLGYNDEMYKFIDRSPKNPEKKNFTFLHYNAFNIRKGFTEVFKAFVKEFKPDEPVQMIFKTTLPSMPIPISPQQYPNIKVICGSISDELQRDLLRQSDCFVFPSRGEGFGLPPLEAMATGMPTIISNTSGMTEYFNTDLMYGVKVKEECPAIYSRYKGEDVGKMFISDVDDLAAQMRYVYEHQDEAFAKGRAAAEYVKQWTFKKTAVKLKEVFDEYSKKSQVDKPLKNALRLEPLRG